MAGPRITAGNTEIISLTDLEMQFPWPAFFPNVPMDEPEKYRELYPESWGEFGFKTDAGCYAIRSEGETIVVDTGLGPGPHEFLRGATGDLLNDMKSKGVPPDDVDIVVHTHLHQDHVGWNMSGDAPTFPNARYYAPQADWDFFNAALAANPQMEQVIPLNDMGRLELYDGEITITSEVTTMATPGHTPGHCSVLVNSDGVKVLIAGDLAHHPAQADRPEWSASFDMDGAEASATRKTMLDRLLEEGNVAAFCHFPGDGFGRIVESNGKRVFRAL